MTTKITATSAIFFEGKCLLILHKKSEVWMFVGGHVEDEEDFDQALRREIKEETGLDVDIIDSAPQGLKPGPDKVRRILHKPFLMQAMPRKEGGLHIALDYICEARPPINVILQKSELDDYKWIGRDEIETLETFPFFRGIIRNAFDEYERVKRQERQHNTKE